MVDGELMSMAAAWPVSVAPLTQVAVGAVRWSVGPHLNVTTLVKGVFEMVPDGPMALAPAEPIWASDQTIGDQHAASLKAVRETVPMLPEVDVVFYGHAHALPARDAPTTERVVRFALLRDDQALIDRSLRVLGDRAADGEPAPFERIPIVYERALGGPGCAANPLGVGWRGAGEEEPNILDLGDPGGTVACFGPIPSAFAQRRKLLAGRARQALEQDGACLPDDFDWSYFQCAPTDQRLESLRGDEWLELDGLTAGLSRVRTQLPGAHGLVRVYGGEAFAIPSGVPLQADLVQIDADRLRCSIVWRGSFPVPRGAALDSLVVVGTIAFPGQPVEWPLEAEQALALPRALPPRCVPASLPAEGEATIALDSPAIEAPGREEPSPSANAVPTDEPTFEMSAAQIAAALGSTPLPFDGAERDPPPPSESADVPGAPWSEEAELSVPPARKGDDTTLDLEDDPFTEESRQSAEAAHRVVADRARAAVAAGEAAERAGERAEQAREAAAAEQARLEAEAEARRQAEAERFATEQKLADEEEQKRTSERRRSREQRSKTLRSRLYGSLGAKKKG